MACKCCGLSGVEGTCSMCYGDPYHNTDGEYLRLLEADRQRHESMEADRRRYEDRMREEIEREAATTEPEGERDDQ